MELRIKIGASTDRSLSTAWQPAIDGARRAAALIESIGARQSRAAGANAKRGGDAEAREYQKAARQIERWEKDKVRAIEKSLSERTRASERAAAAEIRMAERVARDTARIAARASTGGNRDTARRNKESARTNAAITSGGLRAGSRFISGVGSAAMSAGRAASGFGRDMAEGMGVDLSLQSMVAKNTDMEKTAIDVSNSGYMSGDARNGTRVGSAALMKDAFTVGKETGTDANVALEGLAKFTAKTGDLATGRDILKDMAVLSKATGASLEDMVDAAGDTANALGDTDNKAAKVERLMRMFAGQGKLGAVEIRNLASQMAKLGAAAGTFGGGEAAITQMGVLAQEARAKGGAASATQAATSVGSFSNVFSKGARLNAFKSFGIDVHEANGSVRKPKDLILEMLRAASSEKHGGMKSFDQNMGSMVSDVAARRSVKGFENRFKEAGGGEAGIAAVSARFAELEKAVMADTEIMNSFNAAMQGSKSQSEIFNNQLREIALDAQTKLMPAFQQLAPEVIKATKGLADLAVWVAKLTGARGPNPDAEKITQTQAALGSTEVQMAGGKISSAQIAENERLETVTREAHAKAKEELEKSKTEKSGSFWRGQMRGLDYGLGGYLVNKASSVMGGTSTSYGHGFGEALAETEGSNETAAQQRVDALEKQMTELTTVNKAIRDQLANGLIIKQMPPPAGGPPQGDGSGTSNTAATE